MIKNDSEIDAIFIELQEALKSDKFYGYPVVVSNKDMWKTLPLNLFNCRDNFFIALN